MDFEQWCKENGIDHATLSEPARRKLTAAWKADLAPPGNPPPNPTEPPDLDLNAEYEKTKVENDRRRKVTEMVAQAMTDQPSKLELWKALGDQAIQGKWELQKVELEILRASRPGAPGPAVLKGADLDDDVIEAAVCRHAGLRDMEREFKPQVLEAVDRHYRHGMGLQDLYLHYARRGGYRGHSVKSDLKGVVHAARRPLEIQAVGSWGPSTNGANIGTMLANIANKFLRVAFMNVESAWRDISATRTANDFKTITTWSLTGDLTFKKVPPGGEIKHGQVDGTSYTNQVDTYARMLGIDRRDIINDDIGAFTTVARRIGRGGAIAFNRLFWGIFLNNSSFFTAGRNNVSTGAGSALSLAGLDAANQKALLQTDPDGNILGAQMRILLVPPALEVTAGNLMSSTMVVSGNTTPGPNANVFANKFKVASSAYMQDSTLTGNSNAAWYLLADPNDLPVIEAAFLNGVETPTVETSDSDFGMLGEAFRGYFDIGVSLQEYRAGVRSAGS